MRSCHTQGWYIHQAFKFKFKSLIMFKLHFVIVRLTFVYEL
jgi:hypothetical protein